MERELRDFVNLVAALEQAAGGLMAQVVETKIWNTEHRAGPSEGSTDTSFAEREYGVAVSGLALDDLPGFHRVLEPSVVAFSGCRVLGIPHQPGARLHVVVAPSNSADLRLASCRVNGKPHDVAHRQLRSVVASTKELIQCGQLVRGRSAGSSTRLSGQTQLATGVPGFLDIFRVHRQSTDTPIHTRSFATVAGPVPSARLAVT